jgi:serine/threonine protein kinase
VIGEVVGNYRILELIGEVGVGVVYLAEHPGMGRRAAVKVLRASGTRQNNQAAQHGRRASRRPLECRFDSGRSIPCHRR